MQKIFIRKIRLKTYLRSYNLQKGETAVMEDIYWQEFLKTGKIADYLKYKKKEEQNDNS